MGRRRRRKWITQGKPKELKFMFVNNSYIKYLHNLNISALSLSWTASLTYAKLVYGKCFDIIWHHVRPYQWFKENSFFKEANYQVPTPDTCLSYSCQRSVVRLELPLSFIHLTWHSQLSKSKWDCTAWAKLFSECISYIAAFLTSNWKSLCRVKTCSASLTLLLFLWDRGNCSVLMQSKVRISVQTCTSNQDCDEWSLEMCCPSSAFHLDIG